MSNQNMGQGDAPPTLEDEIILQVIVLFESPIRHPDQVGIPEFHRKPQVVTNMYSRRIYLWTNPEMSHQQGDKLDNIPYTMTNDSARLPLAAIEPSEFAAVYDQYFSRVYNYVRYRVQDVDTADEITSQVFERALTKFGSYRPKIAPFGAWLFTIARNIIRDHYRSTRRHPWFSLEALSSQGSSDPLPDEAVENKDTSAMLLWAVHQLPPRE